MQKCTIQYNNESVLNEKVSYKCTKERMYSMSRGMGTMQFTHFLQPIDNRLNIIICVACICLQLLWTNNTAH